MGQCCSSVRWRAAPLLLLVAQVSSQRPPRQLRIRLQVFRLGFRYHFWRQRWGGGSLIPRESFEIIADKLLVEARLAPARLILAGRPEAGGIRREHFVDQDELSVAQTEFKFRIGYDDAPLAGVLPG